MNKIEQILARTELNEDNLLDFLLAGADHMAKIALNEVRDHESAQHFLEVFNIIKEVRNEQSRI